VLVISFPGNDYIHAGFDDGTVYFWNDGIGYFPDSRSCGLRPVGGAA
jgi:hypothetical protein